MMKLIAASTLLILLGYALNGWWGSGFIIVAFIAWKALTEGAR
jgi:hypothetical protein